MGITGSVGMHSGKQCYNFLEDQKRVTKLLNDIPRADGGAEGSLPPPTQWRICSPSLHRAILDFQRRHPSLIADGHVDPDGATIKMLEALTEGSDPSEVHRNICGPMRPVRNGFLPGSIDLDGGPIAQVIFAGFTVPLTVELNVTSPPGAAGSRTYTVSPTSPATPLIDIGMPPPVPWKMDMRILSALSGVRYTFRTDWAPGDPPCVPSR